MSGTILIVDDDSGALKLLKDILTAEGYETRPFNNGELVLRSVIVEKPELILLDVRMPDMNGFEVCSKLKENELLKDIPVIFISAASDMEDKVKAFQAGGVDYITKPFQWEEVIARVKTHLALSHATQEIKETAKKLRKSEASLKMALTIAQLGYWEWNVHTGQVTCSEVAGRIIGLAPNDLLLNLEAFLQIVHPDDRERVANHINQVLEGVNSLDIEYSIILPDGSVRIVQGKGEIAYSEDEMPERIIGTIQEIPEHEHTKMLGVILDITDRKKMELMLEEAAYTDSLTGADTRRHFQELAEQELALVRRYGGQLSVFMLDLDHFKSVNDEHGHHSGDLVIMKLVYVCRVVLREVDVIGRWGGEEFVVLLPKTGAEQALEVAERLRQAIASTEVPLENKVIHFTTSIGVATLKEEDANIDLLLRRADQALYEAKNSGRNKVCVAARLN